jgi:hypothetical protein
MKIKVSLWLVLFCITFVVQNTNAQHKVLSPRQSTISIKTIPLKYREQADTLRLPIVSEKYPALKKALDYPNLLNGDDVDSVVANYKTCGCGITGSDFEVTYQASGIISIKLFFETMGAYPDSYWQWYTLDIGTGKAHSIQNELTPAGLAWVYKSYKKILKQRIINDKRHITEEDEDPFNDLKASVDSLKSSTLFGTYVFTNTGIIFTTDPILPHVIRALEPDRDWFVPYSKLKEFKAAKGKVVKFRL